MKTLWQFFTELLYKKEKSTTSVNPQITDAVTQTVVHTTAVKKEVETVSEVVQEKPKLVLVEKTEKVEEKAEEVKSDVIEIKVEHIKEKKVKQKTKPAVKKEEKKAEAKAPAKRGPKKSKNI
jgi:hypothetical protein